MPCRRSRARSGRRPEHRRRRLRPARQAAARGCLRTPVGHDQNHVAGARAADDAGHYAVSCRFVVGFDAPRAQRRDQLLRVEPGRVVVALGSEEPRYYGVVGLPERLPVGLLEFPPLSGVAAGLEDGDQPLAAEPLPRRLQGRGDRGGVVREVVDHCDAPRFAANLHAAADAPEGAETRADRIPGRARRGCCRHRGQGVENVELPREPHLHVPERRPVPPHREAGGRLPAAYSLGPPSGMRGCAIHSRRPGARPTDAERLNRRARRTAHRAQRRRLPARHQRAGPRHQVDEALEGEAVGDVVAENVRVVKLDVAHHRRPRQVVPHLGALVEIRGVVFVRLDDEELGVREPERDAEVLRDASDEKRRIEPRRLQQPCDQACGGGLAVRSRHRNHMAAGQKPLLDHGGRRSVAQPPVQHLLELGVAPADRVAHHDHVRIAGQVGGIVPVGVVDAQIVEHHRHRRINPLVRARDPVTLRPQEPGERGHRGARDPDQVIVHDFPGNLDVSPSRITLFAAAAISVARCPSRASIRRQACPPR